ncbi:MAG: hypothetical protein IKH07_07555 [Oscillospiraceae bacterium]|nr:hypothetical protein [Oscillospiraceae bacterium]
MKDELDRMTDGEIEEQTQIARRLARHEAEQRRSQRQFYDLQGNFVYWLDQLSRDRNGNVEKNVTNLSTILELDPALAEIAYNRFTQCFEALGPLPWRKKPGPWRDADDAQLICYVDSRYAAFPISYYSTALEAQTDARAFHPVLRFFQGLEPWDGTLRVDSLLIDYLGAPDTPYVRAVTRKTLCAAVRRVFEPGCKFDHILVLSGPQGIGKSSLLARLGMEWFSDSLSVSDMNDKTAAEQLQGHWIIEIGEMAGMKKAELEKVKAFLTRQDDKYRASYGRRVTSHLRQCVFFGTTNEDGYLRDVSGNRRFWTVPVTGQGEHRPWDLSPELLRQIWAEAAILAASEPLYLDESLEHFAREAQREALEQDDREGLVREYLETPIPQDWNYRDYCQRREWYQSPRARAGEKKLVRRDRTSNMEIWCECFGQLKQDLTRKESSAITAIMARIEGWSRSPNPEQSLVYGRQRVYRREAPAQPTQGTQTRIQL